MIPIFINCVNDFFTKKFIFLSLMPFLASLIVFCVLVFLIGGLTSEVIQSKILDLNFITNIEFLANFFASEFFGGAISVLIYTVGMFLSLMISLILAAIISGFLTPNVVKFVDKKYYNLNPFPLVSAMSIFKLYGVILLKFIFIFLLSLLLLFVPIVNIFALNIAFFYLFFQFMLVDVASNCCDEARFKIMINKGGNLNFKISVLAFYLACLIPLVGLFFQLFFIMFLSHLTFKNNIGNIS